MAATIFVRERRKVEAGEKKPRYRIVGIAGPDLKVHVKHARKKELEQIAETCGAKIVYLTEGKGEGKYK